MPRGRGGVTWSPVPLTCHQDMPRGRGGVTWSPVPLTCHQDMPRGRGGVTWSPVPLTCHQDIPRGRDGVTWSPVPMWSINLSPGHTKGWVESGNRKPSTINLSPGHTKGEWLGVSDVVRFLWQLCLWSVSRLNLSYQFPDYVRWSQIFVTVVSLEAEFIIPISRLHQL